MIEEKQIENGGVSVSQIELSKPNRFGHRHVQCGLMFGGLVFGYFLRVNISVAVVPMIEPIPDSNADHFDWNLSTKSLILSSFFWGYVIAQVPAGMLAHKFGAKLILSIATGISAITTCLTPIIAQYGDWQGVCTSRVIIGLTQGVVYPCVHTLLPKWAPTTERGFLSSFVYSGAQFGTVIMLGTSGVFSHSSVGWPSIFYFSGIIAFVWSIGFYFCGSDSPEQFKYISPEELYYIQKYTNNQNNKHLEVPWKELFTSIPFYALIFAHCGFTWGFYTLLSEIPSYLAYVLKKDIKENALLSALPYLTMWLLSLVFSTASDVLINRKIISITTGRKLFNSIGQWIPMICLIGLGYMTKETTVWAIVLLTIAVGFNAASFVGYLVNHMDLSPNFAGHMMGITNGLSNLLSIFAPLVVPEVVKNEEDPSEWRIVFLITAGIYLICNLIFVIFGQASIQKWNNPSTPTVSTTNILSHIERDYVPDPEKPYNSTTGEFQPKDRYLGSRSTDAGVAISRIDRDYVPEKVSKPTNVAARTEDQLIENRPVTATTKTLSDPPLSSEKQ